MHGHTYVVGIVLLLGFTALGSPSVRAQEATPNTRIYIALFDIGMNDLPAWLESYYENSVPILDQLVSEGLITGYNLRSHHTGGEYSIRQGIVGTPETNFEGFWNAYLGRLAERDPADFQRINRSIRAHTDEIWNVTTANIPDGAESRYAYEAQFQINFADMDRWNEAWERILLPVLDRAMENGLLKGYFVENHNTGGRFNWKVLPIFDEWDAFDEVEASLFEAAPMDHEMWSMVVAHRDELWQAAPPPE